MYCDVILAGGRVVTGCGNPWYRADIALKDGRIAAIGRALGVHADEVVDVQGMIVCPGFIDAHSHSDFEYFADSAAQSKVRQGVTLEIIGNCGFSAAPWKGASRRPERTRGYAPTWESMPEYLDALDRTEKAVNIAVLLGHGTLRAANVGLNDRAASDRELGAMQAALAEGLVAGNLGLSLGLYFSPGSYATREELVKLGSVVAKHGGLVAAHIRDEGVVSVGFSNAVKEFLEIGREAKVPINISHIKAHGPASWGLSETILSLLDEARVEGVEITCDQYPYVASGGHIATDSLPLSFQAGKTATEIAKELERAAVRDELVDEVRENIDRRGGPENQILASYAPDRALEGTTIAALAKREGGDPAGVVMDLLCNAGKDCLAIEWVSRAMSDGDVESFMRYPWTMIGTDGAALSTQGPLSSGRPHPRNFGSFPRVLSLYVREKKILRLEEAIRKMTSLPAQVFGISNRGVLTEGNWADIVVFDPETIADVPFSHPKQYPSGILHVLVNGEWVIRDRVFTGALPGRVVRSRTAVA